MQRVSVASTAVRLWSAATLIAVLLLASARGEAQEINATMTGTVTDAQGGVMAGVTITVTNVATNVGFTVPTDASGSFRAQKLQPGPYRVTAVMNGFVTYAREGIVLRTAETATINIQLALGSAREEVMVTAGLSAVETNQSTLAQTMENKRVSELPLNGRQVYMLLQQTAGTLFTQTQFGAQGFSGTRAWDTNGSVSIHGSRTSNNEFLIDGASNAGTGGWSYAPPVDAIEEFKVQTASTDASYGHTSGGVVNLRLRAGTNEIHGSATLFARGTALDSNTVQNIDNGISKSGHKYLDGEGVIRGPLQKDRTFFMLGYQGFYEEVPFPITLSVPTERQRLGDFSQTRNSAGQLITIFDPLTTRPDPTRPGRFIRDPFPGNQIPTNRLNPVALGLLPAIDRPNAEGGITGANNYISSPNLGHYRYNSYVGRIDHVFGPGHRISLSNSANWGSERRTGNGIPAGPSLRTDNWPSQRKNYLGVLDDVIAIGGKVINTRISADRFNEPHPREFGPLGSTTLPFTTPYQVTAEPWYPHLSFGNPICGATACPGQYAEMFGRPYHQAGPIDIYSAQSSMSIMKGKHSLKAGAEFRYYKLTDINQNEENGRFDFTGGFTQRDPQQADSTSGNPVADFLLGYPSGNTFVDITAARVARYSTYALFVQDEWKLSSKGTLSLGLRWDLQSPVTEKDDKLVVGFDAAAPSPLRVSGLKLNGGLLYAGVDGNSRSPYKTDWSDFQPRASFSYRFSDRIVGRANYGRSYFPLTGGSGACCTGGTIQTGYSQRTTMISSLQTGIPFNTLSRPYPDGLVQPFGNALGLATGIGSSISFVNPNFKPPYADMWMAGVGIQLPWDVGLDVAYVGNYAKRLTVNTAIDEVPLAEREKAIASLGGNTSYLSTQLPNPFAGQVPGTVLNPTTVSRQQLLRPYPQFTGITMNMDNKGTSRYNALEAVLNKRLSHGLVAAVNYTFSRQYEALSYLNNGFDAMPHEDLASIDRTHHFTVSALWQLPLRGSRLAEGWQINLLYEIASGTPTASPNGILRQDSAKLPSGQQTLDHWFDNSTRTNPRADGGYAWDTLPPNAFRVAPFQLSDVRDPHISNMSVSVFKNTRLSGKVVLQLRAELFNPFNIAYYGGPDTSITSPTFGKIAHNQFNFPRQGQLGLRFLF